MYTLTPYRKGQNGGEPPIVPFRLLFVGACIALAVLFGYGPAAAQGAYYLPTQLTANTSTSSNSFIAFDITAHQAVRLYRFWNSFSGSGTTIVDICIPVKPMA